MNEFIDLLKPYHNNYNKRLVKSPKFYFYDTGLVSSLLGLESAERLATHYLRGEIFENRVILIMLLKKGNLFHGGISE